MTAIKYFIGHSHSYLDIKFANLTSIHMIVKLQALVLIDCGVLRGEQSGELARPGWGGGLDVHVMTRRCAVGVV